MDDPTIIRARGRKPAQVYLTFGLWLVLTISAAASAHQAAGFGIYFALSVLASGIGFCLLGLVYFGFKPRE
jgi:hypothetical protein